MDKSLPNVGDRIVLAGALKRAMREDGLTQEALGQILGASQPTLSKLLRGRGNPRPGLARGIDAFLSQRGSMGRPPGLVVVMRAYERSESFRQLCKAALELMNEKE